MLDNREPGQRQQPSHLLSLAERVRFHDRRPAAGQRRADSFQQLLNRDLPRGQAVVGVPIRALNHQDLSMRQLGPRGRR